MLGAHRHGPSTCHLQQNVLDGIAIWALVELHIHPHAYPFSTHILLGSAESTNTTKQFIEVC
jgi:hypothetical protein